MKIRFLIGLVCLGLILANMASAKIYKYYDESGNLCVTDDLSIVPESKRPSAEAVLEIKNTPIKNSPPVSKSSKSAHQKSQKLDTELNAEFNRLESMRRNLDSEYAKLNERRNILLLEQDTAKTADQLKQFNSKALELNQETIKYKEKKKIYLKQVAAYNSKLESSKR